VVFGVLLVCSSYVHLYFLGAEGSSLNFFVSNIYLFHAVFSFLLCSVFYVLSNIHKFQHQLGFIYLGALLFKLLTFSVIFYSVLFQQETLSNNERLSLLIPVFVFMVPELYFISKILLKIHPVKN
jgi:hypothetical protein